MKSLLKDFVLPEDGSFSMRLGKWTATSLSGFIAGAVAATIVWFAVLWFVRASQPGY